MLVIWGFLQGNPNYPGPPWLVLNSANVQYICSVQILTSTGVTYSVLDSVKSSTGAVYEPI